MDSATNNNSQMLLRLIFFEIRVTYNGIGNLFVCKIEFNVMYVYCNVVNVTCLKCIKIFEAVQ